MYRQEILQNDDIVSYNSNGLAVHTLSAHGRHHIIVPYNKAANTIKRQVQELLVQEFGPSYFDDKALREICQSGSDMMYVMTSTDMATPELIGCVAVNRKQFYPFVTDLCVVHKYRMKGCARALMEVLEEFVEHLGYTVVMLHCKQDLVPVYQKLGFIEQEVTEQNSEFRRMSKNLVCFNQQECSNW